MPEKDAKPYVTITGGQNHVIMILGSAATTHSQTVSHDTAAPGASKSKKSKPATGSAFENLRAASSAPVSGPITITHKGGAMKNVLIKRKRSGSEEPRGHGHGPAAAAARGCCPSGPEKHDSSSDDGTGCTLTRLDELDED